MAESQGERTHRAPKRARRLALHREIRCSRHSVIQPGLGSGFYRNGKEQLGGGVDANQKRVDLERLPVPREAGVGVGAIDGELIPPERYQWHRYWSDRGGLGWGKVRGRVGNAVPVRKVEPK